MIITNMGRCGLITEPTRVTPTSATIIDLILTNRSENISESSVIHLGISYHSLVYLVRKFTPPKSRKTAREIRNFKLYSRYIYGSLGYDIPI